MASTKPTLSQLQCLVAVCDAGSFNQAATHTGMSQSTLSEAVKNLEMVLDCVLLHRNRQGVTPTAAGARILEQARMALLAVEDMVQIAQSAQEPTGTVRIVSLRSAATRLLPPVLAHLKQQHPRLNVTVLESEIHFAMGETLLQKGDVDLGLLLHPAEGSLLSTPIWKDEWLAITPSQHSPRPQTWDDYHGQTFLVNAGDPRTVTMLDHFFRQQGVTDAVFQPYQDDTMVLAMAEHGLGIALLPRLAISHLPEGLNMHPLPTSLNRTISVMVLPNRASLPLIQVVRKALLQQYRPSDLHSPETSSSLQNQML